MHIVHQVGALKAKSGGTIYRPERKKLLLIDWKKSIVKIMVY